MKHKSIFKRTLSAALCALMLFPVAGCTVNIKPISSTEEELTVVGTVGGQDVYYEELRYVVLNTKEDMKLMYGDTIWDTEESAASYLEELTTRVKQGLENDYHAIYAMADYYYVSKGEGMFAESAIQSAVTDSINELAEECGGKKDYIASLEENHLTDHLIRYYYTATECATELLYILMDDLGEVLSSDEEIEELMHSDSFIRTNHIFLSGLTEENAAKAEEIRQELLSSTDLEYEIWFVKTTEKDADTSITTTHGAYFAWGTSDYGNAYEKAALSLKVGEVSEVVRSVSTDYLGYFVIVRLPVEDDWLTANYDDYSEDIILSQFNVILQEFQDELEFTFNEYGSGIDLLQID